MLTGFDVAKDQEAKSGDYQRTSAFASDEAATGMVRFKCLSENKLNPVNHL